MAAGDRLKDENVRSALFARMGWNVSDPPCPFACLICFTLNQEQIAVVAVRDDKMTVLNDESGLFPSDALVAQLRLLQEATK